MNTLLTQAELLKSLMYGVTSYLEVGVQEGRSLQIAVNAAHRLERITLCDEWGTVSGGSGRGSHDHIRQLLVELGYKGQVTYLDGDSRQTLPFLHDTFTLVHIDGGHSFEVASSDIWQGWRVCRGIMLVHDTSFSEVWRALSMFLTMTTDQPMRVEYYTGGHGTAVLYRGN